jgi:copper(I)-binding protein
MKFTRFAGLALVGTAFLLSGCGDNPAPTEATADNQSANLEITNARLVLPPVSGNPGAVYMDVKNIGDENVALRKAEVKGAGKTMIHNTMEVGGQMMMNEAGPMVIAPGSSETFKPGGTHVMAFDLDPSLTAGTKTKITLTIAGGKTSTGEVEVVGAGSDR